MKGCKSWIYGKVFCENVFGFEESGGNLERVSLELYLLFLLFFIDLEFCLVYRDQKIV